MAPSSNKKRKTSSSSSSSRRKIKKSTNNFDISDFHVPKECLQQWKDLYQEYLHDDEKIPINVETKLWEDIRTNMNLHIKGNNDSFCEKVRQTVETAIIDDKIIKCLLPITILSKSFNKGYRYFFHPKYEYKPQLIFNKLVNTSINIYKDSIDNEQEQKSAIYVIISILDLINTVLNTFNEKQLNALTTEKHGCIDFKKTARKIQDELPIDDIPILKKELATAKQKLGLDDDDDEEEDASMTTGESDNERKDEDTTTAVTNNNGNEVKVNVEEATSKKSTTTTATTTATANESKNASNIKGHIPKKNGNTTTTTTTTTNGDKTVVPKKKSATTGMLKSLLGKNAEAELQKNAGSSSARRGITTTTTLSASSPTTKKMTPSSSDNTNTTTSAFINAATTNDSSSGANNNNNNNAAIPSTTAKNSQQQNQSSKVFNNKKDHYYYYSTFYAPCDADHIISGMNWKESLKLALLNNGQDIIDKIEKEIIKK